MKNTFIIAEAGVNHNGSLKMALELVDVAKKCGVDAIKFQCFNATKLASVNAKKASYQDKNDKNSTSQLEMLKNLSLSYDDFKQIKNYCDKIKIKFLTTAFDEDSLNFIVKDLKVDILKIPSGEVTNYPYLVECAKTKLPLIVSTGMCSLNEVKECLNVLKKNGAKNISLLHCTTEYPAPLDSINLLAMKTLGDVFKTEIGYSDHTEGINVSCYAVCMGASIIEKHFTLDKSLPGPDHKASLNPDELKLLVENIKQIQQILGNGKKEPSNVEIKNIAVARKSIVALCDIKAGEIFTKNNITCKRPGDGLSPMKWEKILGKKAKKDFIKDEKISL